MLNAVDGDEKLTATIYRSELALVLKPMIAAKAKERQATSTGGKNPQLRQKSAQAETGKTREELAKLAGVSRDTISQYHSGNNCVILRGSVVVRIFQSTEGDFPLSDTELNF